MTWNELHCQAHGGVVQVTLTFGDLYHSLVTMTFEPYLNMAILTFDFCLYYQEQGTLIFDLYLELVTSFSGGWRSQVQGT